MKQTPHLFSILDEDTCRRLCQEAVGILQTKGFRAHSPRMRRLLADAGARIHDGDIVCLPPELVAEAVAAAPAEFDLHDLDGTAVRVREGSLSETIGTYVEAIQWLDYGAEMLRPSTLADLQKGLMVADSLPQVCKAGVVVTPMDVPVPRQLAQALRAILTTTRKSLSFGIQNVEQAGLILDALAAATPDLDLKTRPVGTFACSPTSPFVLDADTADVLICTLGRGLVPILAPCPMAGATSQFSVIGTVLQQLAEDLFMLAAKFAVLPEAPAVWGGAGAALDMRSGDVSYGGIERSLMMVANIDVACHLGLPVHSPAGSVDSCLIDAQLGAEKAWTFLTRVLSRAAVGIGIGAVANGKAVSAEQMVIDMDLCDSVRRFAAGIDMDQLPAAVEEIAGIAHGGDFMMSEVTLALLREGAEYVYPPTFNRDGTHAAPMLQRAHDRVESLLTDWRNPVPERIREDIDRLLS